MNMQHKLLAAMVAALGIAAGPARADVFDLGTFMLNVDLSSVAALGVTTQNLGFTTTAPTTTAGGSGVGAISYSWPQQSSSVTVNLPFTVTAMPGWSLSSVLWADQGTWTVAGSRGNVVISDAGSTFDNTVFQKATSNITAAGKSGNWSVSGSTAFAPGGLGSAFSGVASYTLSMSGTGTVASTGGGFYAETFSNPVPEPGEWALMFAGLGMVGTVIRRRSRKA